MSETAFDIRLRAPLSRFELDFQLSTGAHSVGIFGASGAGKTSALEAAAGWRAVREGRVSIGSRVLLDTRAGVRVPMRARGIGYVPQDALLFPHWSVRENIRAGERRAARSGATETAFERVIEVLELARVLDARPASLSGGERQRVALARALCSQPACLFLDEPLGALDLPLRRRILPYLIRVRDAFDLPMLFVSHDPTEVQALCEEVAVMETGRIVRTGAPQAVLRTSGVSARDLENVMRGAVVSVTGGAARVEIARGIEFQVPSAGLVPGETALFSLGADEILVSVAPLERISARNVLPARIVRISLDGESVLLDADLSESGAPGASLRVLLTAASTRDLELHEGARVYLVIKTQSCRVLSSLGTA